MRVRRVLLYMPGDAMKKIRKAATLGVDAIVMDLEDGVALNRKDVARTTILEALHSLPRDRTETLVRVNPVGSGWTASDIFSTIAGKPDGYVLPKVSGAADLIYVDHLLTDLEAAHGFARGSISLQAIIESARGLMEAREIAASSHRLTALQLGMEDLAADIGAKRSSAGEEVLYARSHLVTVATAHGLVAIDGIFLALDDPEGCYREARHAADLGFQGKLAIHPAQVEPIVRAFTPDDEQIRAARRIVDAAAQQQAEGYGAFALDGKMVDQPVVEAAKRLLARA
jgi:citrate lyase beta subunit